MKVLEVKNNLIKTNFSPADKVALGGFLIIEDVKNPYVSQVMNIKEDVNGATAISKLLFTFDKEGVLRNYNGTIPAVNANVSTLDVNELLEILPYETPLKIGRIAQQKSIIKLDKKILQNNFLICSDKHSQERVFVNNLITQLNELSKRSIIFDLDGHYEAENKIKFPQDFQLPLNYDTIGYIYERELEDIEITSKAIIQDILIELQEYSKVAEGNFIPFNSFLQIIDAQYSETKIPQLILLKNKLLKYKDDGVFAQTLESAQSLNKILDDENTTVIDLSGADCELMQEQILDMIYSYLEQKGEEVYTFIRLAQEHARKPLLKLLTAAYKVHTTIICPHDFKYIKELKSIAKNIVFFAPTTIQHDFGAYNTLLNKLNSDEFVVIGESTQQIPFLVHESIISEDDIVEDMPLQAEEDSVFFNGNKERSDINDATQVEPLTSEESFVSEIKPFTVQEEPVSNVIEEPTLGNIPLGFPMPEPVADTVSEPIIEPIAQEEVPEIKPMTVDDSMMLAEEPEQAAIVEKQTSVEDLTFAEPQNLEQETISSESELELEGSDEFDGFDIIEDMSQANVENSPMIEEIPEIVENPIEDNVVAVDELDNITADDLPFNPESTESQQDSIDFIEDLPLTEFEEPVAEGTPEIVEGLSQDKDDFDDFADSLIHEESTGLPENNLNSLMLEEELDFTTSQESGVQNTSSSNSNYDAFESMPVVEDTMPSMVDELGTGEEIPVYPAMELNDDSSMEFKAGDNVNHPTYGVGTVEKIISYGNKKLCSIMFANNNRRLLDPSISSLTKV
jgi:hypothetical protein